MNQAIKAFFFLLGIFFFILMMAVLLIDASGIPSNLPNLRKSEFNGQAVNAPCGTTQIAVSFTADGRIMVFTYLDKNGHEISNSKYPMDNPDHQLMLAEILKFQATNGDQIKTVCKWF